PAAEPRNGEWAWRAPPGYRRRRPRACSSHPPLPARLRRPRPPPRHGASWPHLVDDDDGALHGAARGADHDRFRVHDVSPVAAELEKHPLREETPAPR